MASNKQIRRNLGSYLKKLREKQRMSLSEVVAYLSLHKIKCSKSNLSRIEIDGGAVRSDILAGLALIYDIDVDEILYK